jgi:hypothetical protein
MTFIKPKLQLLGQNFGTCQANFWFAVLRYSDSYNIRACSVKSGAVL